jgi:Helix-turn-helix domain
MSDGRTDAPPDEGLTVAQAAARLGMSKAAIRKRVQRGTIRATKGQDGQWYVHVTEATAGATAGTPPQDTRGAPRPTPSYDEIIARQDQEIAFLRRQLEAKDVLLNNAIGRLAELKALRATTERIAGAIEAETRDIPGNETQDTTHQPPARRIGFWERLFWGSQGKRRV